MKFTSPPPYQLVLWLSAKKRRFQEGKVDEINRPDFHNLDSALSQILVQYGWIDEAEFPVERKRCAFRNYSILFPH